MPTLPADRLAGAYLYYDAQADDARLTLTIAAHRRARPRRRVANHAASSSCSTTAAGWPARVVEADGRRIEVRARAVVNAAGVWATTCGPSTRAPTPTPSARRRASTSRCRGRWCATTSPWSCPVPKDKRSVFVVPWPAPTTASQLTYIGTTDTDYDGPIEDPQCTPEDVDYLLGAINPVHAPSRSPRPTSSAPGPGCARS